MQELESSLTFNLHKPLSGTGFSSCRCINSASRPAQKGDEGAHLLQDVCVCVQRRDWRKAKQEDG